MQTAINLNDIQDYINTKQTPTELSTLRDAINQVKPMFPTELKELLTLAQHECNRKIGLMNKQLAGHTSPTPKDR